jgi:hypothetical protein
MASTLTAVDGEESQVFGTDVKRDVFYSGLFFLISGGFIYWASISWNTALSATFSKFFSNSDLGRYAYAIFVTIVAIIVIGLMAYFFDQKAFKN